MKTSEHQPEFEPFLQNHRSFLLLRWLLIVLAAYLALFSNLGNQNFIGIFALVAAFSASNIVMAFLPQRELLAPSSLFVTLLDAAFICGFLYILRVPGWPVHFPLMAILAIALIRRDLRVVVFALLTISILFGVFSYAQFLGLAAVVPLDQFLALALFFVVAVFYVFLVARFDRDALTTAAMLQEAKSSEAMVEIARTLSTLMTAEEIYAEVVRRLRDSVGGASCSVVRVDGDQAVVLTSSGDALSGGETIALDTAPAVRTACRQGRAIYLHGGKENGIETADTAAIPILVRNEVTAVIYLKGALSGVGPSGTMSHFFELVASTAGNALRNVEMFEDMKHLARTDFLTGLPNHRYFQSVLSREVSRAQRHNHTLSLLIIDLDFLKKVNDQFGHPAGDSVIRGVANTIQSTCREIDFAARYGGEEFVVILPETDLEGAVQVAERVRGRIEDTDVGIIGRITASVGLANYPVNATSKEDLIRVADQALYVAKNGGRNRVAHFPYQLTSSM